MVVIAYNFKKILGMLMDDKNNLTGAIVDCLNALGLDNDIRNDVQDRILSKIISGEISPKVLPVVMTVCY